MNWPELRLGIKKAKTPRCLVRPLRRARKPRAPVAMPEFMLHPIDFVNECWEFSRSKWYNGNPRQLAGALAGLPKLSWKRSFDICSASRPRQQIDQRAYRDFLQRKFPDRFREILRARSENEIIFILRRSRTKDSAYEYLLRNPRLVSKFLRVGLPGVWG
jgi:hypothetical protein